MGWEPGAYGDRIADIYDELHAGLFDDVGAVSFLAERAAGGPVLELAIGTGRLAVPLAERGVEVHGVDISERMVDKLRAKPGGARIPVTIGDMREVPVDGVFPLVYLVFNTFFGLRTQDDQIRCLTRIAEHLTPQGVFVIEAFVPDTARFERHQNTEVSDVTADRVVMHASRHDPVEQTIAGQIMLLSEAGTKLVPVFLRYAYPPELDLMARLAGLELRERYADWRRTPFTSSATSHVSVYGRA